MSQPTDPHQQSHQLTPNALPIPNQPPRPPTSLLGLQQQLQENLVKVFAVQMQMQLQLQQAVAVELQGKTQQQQQQQQQLQQQLQAGIMNQLLSSTASAAAAAAANQSTPPPHTPQLIHAPSSSSTASPHPNLTTPLFPLSLNEAPNLDPASAAAPTSNTLVGPPAAVPNPYAQQLANVQRLLAHSLLAPRPVSVPHPSVNAGRPLTGPGSRGGRGARSGGGGKRGGRPRKGGDGDDDTDEDEPKQQRKVYMTKRRREEAAAAAAAAANAAMDPATHVQSSLPGVTDATDSSLPILPHVSTPILPPSTSPSDTAVATSVDASSIPTPSSSPVDSTLATSDFTRKRGRPSGRSDASVSKRGRGSSRGRGRGGRGGRISTQVSEDEGEPHLVDDEDEVMSATDGRIRINGTVYVPMTFTTFGQKYKKRASTAATATTTAIASSTEPIPMDTSSDLTSNIATPAAAASTPKPRRDRTLIRLARLGGVKPTLPNVDYEPASIKHQIPISPYAFGPRPDADLHLSQVRQERRTRIKQKKNYQDDLDPETRLAIELSLQTDGVTTELQSDEERKSFDVDESQPRAPRSAPKTRGTRGGRGGARGRGAKPRHGGGRKMASADIDLTLEDGTTVSLALPTFERRLTRQSLYVFPASLTFESLPVEYQEESFVSIMERIAVWQARLGLNKTQLAQEMNCSPSTIYFLLTNTYKFDLTNYDIRVRHYLWRTDQWCVGRTKQYLEEKIKNTSMRTDADAATPMPEELTSAGVSQSDWTGWLNFTLQPLSEREPIDNLVYPLIQPLEAAVPNQHTYLEPIPKVKIESTSYKSEWKESDVDANQPPMVSSTGRPMRQVRQKLVDNLDPADFLDDEAEVPIVTKSLKRTKQQHDDGEFKEGSSSSSESMSSEDELSSTSSSDEQEEDETDDGSISSKKRKRSLKPKSFSSKKSVRTASTYGHELDDGTGIVGMVGRNLKTKRVRREVNFDIPTLCTYPSHMNHQLQLRQSATHAHTMFDHPNWRIHTTGRTITTQELIQSFLPQLVSSSANIKQFTSNQQQFQMRPFQNLLRSHQQQESKTASFSLDVTPAASSTSSSPPVRSELDAFTYLGAPISTMAWCPLDRDLSPETANTTATRIDQFLAVALDHTEDYVRLSHSHSNANGAILIYRVPVVLGDLSRSGASAAPFPILALTHTHGTCVSLVWYPHALETMDRLGVLAAIFVDGTAAVRAIPRVQLDSSENIQQFQFDSLPGVTLDINSATHLSASSPIPILPSLTNNHFETKENGMDIDHQEQPPISSSALIASILSSGQSLPTSLVWSHAPQTSLVAVGTNDGQMHIFDLAWTQDQAAGQINYPPTTSIMTYSSALITSLAFHPVTPYLLAGCNFSGASFVYDLRSPSLPTFLHPVNSFEPCRNLVWPQVAHPAQELLLATQGNFIQQIPLSTFSTVRIEPANSMEEIALAKQLPVAEHGRILSTAVGDRDSLQSPIILITASSDGAVNGYGINLDRMKSGVGATIGLSRTNVLLSPDHTMDISDSFPVATNPKKGRVSKFLSDVTPAELATQTEREIHSVAINPNIRFPRIIASAGISGIIRFQASKQF